MSSIKGRQDETAANFVEDQSDQEEVFNDEVWQKIVEALVARGYPAAKKELETRDGNRRRTRPT
jgi:hypothetical protein